MKDIYELDATLFSVKKIFRIVQIWFISGKYWCYFYVMFSRRQKNWNKLQTNCKFMKNSSLYMKVEWNFYSFFTWCFFMRFFKSTLIKSNCLGSIRSNTNGEIYFVELPLNPRNINSLDTKNQKGTTYWKFPEK